MYVFLHACYSTSPLYCFSVEALLNQLSTMPPSVKYSALKGVTLKAKAVSFLYFFLLSINLIQNLYFLFLSIRYKSSPNPA